MNDDGRSVLFRAGALRARALGEADLPELQRFFEANPRYFEAVNGAPPRPDEAAQEFHDRPPPSLAFGRVHVIGVHDAAGEMVAMASVVENLVADSVWHIALFIVATRLHGSGAAIALHQSLQAWAVAQGARWLRLGVVCGNARAERFWQKAGYIEVRQRDGVVAGTTTNRVSVRIKPLAGEGIDAYLRLVARDRPGAD